MRTQLARLAKRRAPLQPSHFITLTFHSAKARKYERRRSRESPEVQITITDNAGSGPFKLTLIGQVVAPKEKPLPPVDPPVPPDPKVDASPSRIEVKEVDNGPDALPITIQKVPNSERLQLIVNKGSQLLIDARGMRPDEDALAVELVFKYGLALTAMGLLDSAKKSPEWAEDQAACRDRIEKSSVGVARVIVPLCLSLPKKLPKAK